MAGSLYRNLSILCFVAGGVACGDDPVYRFQKAEEKSVGGEVFRVLCKREARDSFPGDLDGMRFNDACDGKGEPLTESSDRLNALLARREELVAVVDRVLGENDVAQPSVVTVLEDGELQAFLKDLVPLYDKPAEVLPKATRALAASLARLIDPEDTTGRAALTAMAEITDREGYRPADLALGLLGPLLEYPELDAFAENGLKAIATGGVAEKSLDELSLGLSLEMAAYTADPPAEDSTLLIVRDFLLGEIEQVDQPTREPIWVTRRDPRGVAVPKSLNAGGFMDADGDGMPDVTDSGRLMGTVPTPFAVDDEMGVQRDAAGRAIGADGTPLFDYFDAQLTMAAAFLREDARLSSIQPGQDRTTFEKLGRGLPVLFGTPTTRTVQYGAANVTYEGLDPSKGAMYDLVHAVGMGVAQRPDAARKLMIALARAMRDNEPAMAQLVQTMIRINDRSKEPRHDAAKLIGEQGEGTPHRFWDDLLDIGARAARRDGMVEALIRMVTQDEAVAMGPLIAKWLEYTDTAPYKNADFTAGNADGTFTAQQEEDLNAQVTRTYQTPVDRNSLDIGSNRSVFHQTLSMVHSLNGRGICNKEGSTLPLLLTITGFTLPLGQPQGYPECDLFEVEDMIQIWAQAILDRSGQISLKPVDLSLLGYTGATGAIQEIETQIHGFNDRPTPESLARFLFGPPNQFSQALIDPPRKDGALITELDPYALFAMEVPHQDVSIPGSGSGATFLQVAKPLVAAFDENELRDPLTGVLQDGYLFGDLLDVLYMHWGMRSDAPCNGPPEPTCTQHTDPAAPFFSYQTNLGSYGPLLIETLRDENFMQVLSNAAKALQAVDVEGEDGLALLGRFVEGLLLPAEGMTYRDGSDTAYTNVGDAVGYVSPMYLVLDGLKRMDTNFEQSYPANEEGWDEAVSEIVDLFLTVEEVNGQKRLQDRIGRSVFIKTLEFLAARIEAHQTAGDVAEWGAGLGQRSVDFFDTPMIAGALHLIDDSWEEPAAGRELLKFIRYLVDDTQNPLGFETTLVAVTDLLQLMEDSRKIAPLLDLAAEAVVPGAPAVVDGTAGVDTLVPRDGLLRNAVELQNDLLKLHTRRPSTLSRVAKNLVRVEGGEVKTPVETFLDILAETQREDPKVPDDATLTASDLELIAKTAHAFVSDDGKGLERLYAVIQNRVVAGSSSDDAATDTPTTTTGTTGMMMPDGGTTGTAMGGTTGTTTGTATGGTAGTATGGTAGTATGGTAGTTTGMTTGGTAGATAGTTTGGTTGMTMGATAGATAGAGAADGGAGTMTDAGVAP